MNFSSLEACVAIDVTQTASQLDLHRFSPHRGLLLHGPLRTLDRLHRLLRRLLNGLLNERQHHGLLNGLLHEHILGLLRQLGLVICGIVVHGLRNNHPQRRGRLRCHLLSLKL